MSVHLAQAQPQGVAQFVEVGDQLLKAAVVGLEEGLEGQRAEQLALGEVLGGVHAQGLGADRKRLAGDLQRGVRQGVHPNVLNPSRSRRVRGFPQRRSGVISSFHAPSK
jgi:hypothetical protein